MRGAAVAAAAALALVSVSWSMVPAGADNAFGGPEIVVAVLDTGIRPTHQEFTFGGSASTTDQFVGWWDFTADGAARHRPAPGQLWDTAVPTPYDNHGHGTGTASMAVGKNVDPAKHKSFCPGCRLAVAKVLNGAGSGTSGDIRDGLLWAIDDVGADVISISLGGGAGPAGLLPVLGSMTDLDEVLAHARGAGALVVVAAGNGYLNAGIPGLMSWENIMGFSPDVFVIGGASATGGASLGFSYDSEVTAHGLSVRTAYRTSDTSHTTWSGTSFAAPQAAGMAADVMGVAQAAGCGGPDYVETLLKHVARDTVNPPTLEGYGNLGALEHATARAAAATCSLPARPAADLNALYVDVYNHALRVAITQVADFEGTRQVALTPITATTGAGVIGATAPAGVGEAELWSMQVAAGDRITIGASYTTPGPGPVNDFDVYLFGPGAAADGALLGPEIVAWSTASAGANEVLRLRATASGAYTLMVVGWTIVDPQGYAVTVSGATGPTAFVDERVVALVSL